MKIYIVYGCTGEYSDRQRWNVEAFKSLKKANTFKNKLNNWLIENNASYGSINGKEEYFSLENELICPFDPDFRFDYTGAKYDITEVELDES